jgi:hypothetical protein
MLFVPKFHELGTTTPKVLFPIPNFLIATLLGTQWPVVSMFHKMFKQGVCQLHCGLGIYVKKYLKAKEELWKIKYFTMQKYNLQK